MRCVCLITLPAALGLAMLASPLLITLFQYKAFSQYDVCPNIIIEALCHGLPIIACDSGGIPEIVKKSGILLPVKTQLEIDSFNLNFEYGVEPPNEKKVYDSILRIKEDQKKYKTNLQKYLFEEISYKVGCDLYENYLKT